MSHQKVYYTVHECIWFDFFAERAVFSTYQQALEQSRQYKFAVICQTWREDGEWHWSDPIVLAA